MSLAYLAIITAEGFGGDTKRVYDALLNRIDIDGRGAYLKVTATPMWAYYETTIKDTALLLKAFVAHKDENSETGNVLRWLLAGRDTRGVWGSTHNIFIVVDAMTEYLTWQHETEAQFSLRGLLDGASVFEHDFNAGNIFETFTHFIPIDTFVREKLVPLTLSREDTNGRQNTLYYDMSLKYFLPVASLPPRDEGITVVRNLYELNDSKNETPVQRAKVGDIVRGRITIMVPSMYQHVAIEDFIPAGFEIVNFNLDTETGMLDAQSGGLGFKLPQPVKDNGFLVRTLDRISSLFGNSQTAQVYGEWGYENTTENDSHKLYPSHVESHDDRVFLYVESLSPGVYEYEYYLRALVPGTFQHLPARAEELYFPEVFGRTSGEVITVTQD
jgi:uncharacterized protein YfaS (alpha-2-macroglobulin family)